MNKSSSRPKAAVAVSAPASASVADRVMAAIREETDLKRTNRQGKINRLVAVMHPWESLFTDPELVFDVAERAGVSLVEVIDVALDNCSDEAFPALSWFARWLVLMVKQGTAPADYEAKVRAELKAISIEGARRGGRESALARKITAAEKVAAVWDEWEKLASTMEPRFIASKVAANLAQSARFNISASQVRKIHNAGNPLDK